jgi:hypothetical protein
MAKEASPGKSPAGGSDGAYKSAFVLMPFCDPYNSYYEAIFKPALEDSGYRVSRADDLFEARPIILSIQTSILEADLLLCEMSGRNPNVFYELGLAHAIGRPAILVSHIDDDIPFDLRHIRVITYNYSLAGWEAKLREDIRQAVRDTNNRETIWPPPLLREPGTSGALLSAKELRIKSRTKRREIAIEGNLEAIETLHRRRLMLYEAGVGNDDPEILNIAEQLADAERALIQIEEELVARDG